MLLGDLIKESEYTYLSDPDVLSIFVSGISSDSKMIEQGYVFVSLKGTVTDGALYLQESISRGARAVVCESVPALCTIPYIRVKNARRALAWLLHRFWGEAAARMQMFASTGTNGKTSTTTYLREILKRAGARVGYIGSTGCYLNNDKISLSDYDNAKITTMTTPDPEQLYKILYEMQRQGASHVVMEASSHALRLDKLAPLSFKSGIFTNFSAEHLDFHFDMTDYLLSKCRLHSQSTHMFLNADDIMCRHTYGLVDNVCYTFGIDFKGADYRALNISYNGFDGVRYTLRSPKTMLDVVCKTPGRFTVYNTLAASSVALNEGVDKDIVSDAISNIDNIEGRFEVLELGENNLQKISVIIDYAHTERALRNLLSTVRSVGACGRRIVTVFGCGGDRDREKRAPMGKAASELSDLVIITEDNSRSEDTDRIIADILCGVDKNKSHKVIPDRRSAIEYAIKNAEYEDIILLVGKGHEEYEIKNNMITRFSEKEIVYELMEVEAEER